MEKFTCSINRLDLLILVWVGFQFLSFLINTTYSNFTDKILVLGAQTMTFFYLRFALMDRNPVAVVPLMVIVCVYGTIESIHALLQMGGILPNIFPFKFGGVYGNPGDLANFLVLSYTISLGLFFYTAPKNYRYFFLFSALLQIIVIAASSARTAWLACILSSLGTLWFFRFRHITAYSFYKKFKNNKLVWEVVY
jgi:hypothetical protein